MILTMTVCAIATQVWDNAFSYNGHENHPSLDTQTVKLGKVLDATHPITKVHHEHVPERSHRCHGLKAEWCEVEMEWSWVGVSGCECGSKGVVSRAPRGLEWGGIGIGVVRQDKIMLVQEWAEHRKKNERAKD